MLERLQFDAEYSTGDHQKLAIQKLKECPDIAKEALFFWRAYQELETERAIGMDAGQIPFSSIMNYATEFRLKGAERECLLRIIRRLDNRWHILRDEKRKREENKTNKAKGSGVGQVVDNW